MQTKVKEMRERAGLTQKQLADALGSPSKAFIITSRAIATSSRVLSLT